MAAAFLHHLAAATPAVPLFSPFTDSVPSRTGIGPSARALSLGLPPPVISLVSHTSLRAGTLAAQQLCIERNQQVTSPADPVAQICQTAVGSHSLSSGWQQTAASCYVLLLCFSQMPGGVLKLPRITCANHHGTGTAQSSAAQ